MSIDPVIAGTLRSLLALLFVAAACHKLTDWTAFRIVVHDYEVLPSAIASPVAAAIVGVELAVAVTFPWQATVPYAAAAAVLLLSIYSGAIAVNLLRGRRILDCGCAPSTYRQPLGAMLLVRNAVLVLAAAAAMLPVADRGLGWLDGLTGVAAATATVLLWSSAQVLLTAMPVRRAS